MIIGIIGTKDIKTERQKIKMLKTLRKIIEPSTDKLIFHDLEFSDTLKNISYEKGCEYEIVNYKINEFPLDIEQSKLIIDKSEFVICFFDYRNKFLSEVVDQFKTIEKQIIKFTL